MAEKSTISGLILDGTKIEGKCTFKDKMRIDGDFSGEIESENQLIIGKSAKVHAIVSVGELIVMGQLEGEIKKCGNLQVMEGGKVIGDINVSRLEIKPGAIFHGKCSMITQQTQPTPK